MKTIISNVLIVLIISAMLVSVGWICISRAMELSDTYNIDTSEYEIREYYISPNDTLWELGKELKQEDDDLRTWVAAVKKLNNMKESDLSAGDVINVYVAI